MGNRIVGISSLCDLSIRNRQLLIRAVTAPAHSIPVEDLSILVLDHQGIRITQAVFQECLQNNVTVLLCDPKHLPQSVLQPLIGNCTQARVQREQLQASLPRRKQIWQMIVRAKILQQAVVLSRWTQPEPELNALATRVASGDPRNCEAQAARLYWKRLFGRDFKRDPEHAGPNSFLNYGYAIVRAALARSVVAAGLNPIFSVHHANQQNPFALVDDMIEPLRPRVDSHVKLLIRRFPDRDLTPEAKRGMLELLTQEALIENQSFPILLALDRYAVSLRTALSGKHAIKLDIPVL